MQENLLWIPLLPFLGFLLNGLLGKKFGPRFVSWVGAITPIGAFLVTIKVWNEVRDQGLLRQHVFDWIQVGDFSAPFALLADPLSCVMCLVITGIGSLIHLYSIDYMRGDPGYHRYFAYLNLFTACMLVLVLADNLLLMFVGWEGVGLCSYLLIGFWFEDKLNSRAGQKAFIVNRIGDFGVLLAIFLCYKFLGTIDTREVVSVVSQHLTGNSDEAVRIQSFGTFWGLGLVDWITLLPFVGATGKSAQIPLYVWLPDAMAGPTPVSALIHAATMVTSGVYLCCRMAGLFENSAFTLAVIAVIGACTALLAALIALSQNDIKKVLAYSTVSQLGYMFFAVGMGAFSAAFLHVVTHAFFKALLFLGSGSVIHAMHHEQDMRKMGGLRKQLPITHATYLIGTLAIAGVPFFSGFFSKDEILFEGYYHAFGHDHSQFAMVFWGVGVLTAALTAFYMLRSVALTFWGESRIDPKLTGKVHEPGGWIQFALIVLAFLAIFGGTLGVPEFMSFWPDSLGGDHHIVGKFTGLYSDHGEGLSEAELHSLHAMEWTSLAISVLAGMTGLLLALYLYGPGRKVLAQLVAENAIGRRMRQWSEDKFYVDELYDLFIVKPFELTANLLWMLIDRLLIDTILVHGMGSLARGTGNFFRRMQSGYVPAYLLTFGCGALVLIFIMLSILKDTGS